MELKSNRILISKSEVFNTINTEGNQKLDLSFMDKSNYISLKDLTKEIEEIKKRNFPLLRRVIEALESGKIILSKTSNAGSSIVYVYGMDASNNVVEKVFVNMTKFIKTKKGVDGATGNFIDEIEVIGGVDVLYNLLLSGYIGLNAKRVYTNPTISVLLRNAYADIISMIVSTNKFGNPIDGAKFRFIASQFFHNGTIEGVQLASALGYPADQAGILATKYPDFFKTNAEGLRLSDMVDIINSEFPSISRNNFSTKGLIFGAVTTVGDTGVYLLDNHAYMLSVFVGLARKAQIFKGYGLKRLDVKYSALLSGIYQTLM